MPKQQTTPTTATPSTPPAPTDGSGLAVLRQIESQPQVRALAIDSDTINKETRTVEVAVSSEYPVRRWFGMEVLDHGTDAIDMHRLQAGAPLLDQHRRQIGVVEEAWLTADRRLRAKVRFSRGEYAEEIWQDVIDGIRRNISCGYLIHEMVLERTDGDLDHYRVTRWEPYEVSSVSVPADPTVGVGRSLPEATNTITIRGTAMPKPNETPNAAGTTEQPQGGQRQHAAEPVDHAKAERQRCADIIALGDMQNRRELAQQAVEAGTSVSEFMRSLREATGAPGPTPTPGVQQDDRDLPRFMNQPNSLRELGVSDKEADSYSLMRAINAAADNDWDKAGLEREISVAISDKVKKEARGFFVPHEILQRTLGAARTMEKKTAGKGPELVATDLRVDQFIDILRNEALVAGLGARILSGLVGDVDLPKKVSGAGFSWITEGADAPLTDMDLSTLRLSPKTIAGGIPVTRKLRKQASLSIEAMIIQDLTEGLAVALDYAMLLGSGIDDEPLGLLNQTGLGGLEYADNMSWAQVVELETKVRAKNARKNALSYLTSVVQDGYAKTAEKFAGTGKTIADNGRTNGYPLNSTNQMPDDAWLFGDFSQLVCGMWGVMDLKPDTATLAGSDGLILRVFQDADVGVRRPESFALARKTVA